ncbi:MAG TPA: hypothetical protein VFX98_10850 [Longimicrobiaceae bacterium]|nr:hypothetical protein [Longimicrobiaceae bacterium]
MVPRLSAALAVLLAAAPPLAAQDAPCPAPADSAAVVDTTGRRPDVRILGSVSARELRFESEPRARLRLTGCVAGDSVRVLERRNLPERVQPGVVYRDVFIRVEIAAFLNPECVRELLAGTVRPAPADSAARRPACIQRRESP